MASKDWVGNQHSIYVTLGASNHVEEERQAEDFYATAPEAGEWLLRLEPQLNNIYENFVGQGHLAEVFRKSGKLKAVSDLIDRGYHPEGIVTKYPLDFFKFSKLLKNTDIVSNPPYSFAKLAVEHSLELIEEGHYVAMFLKTTFLEGKDRKKFFEENPPLRVWVSSSRIPCAKNGEFEVPKKDKEGNVKLDDFGKPIMEKVSSAVSYSWFVWQKGYKGDPVIKWFN